MAVCATIPFVSGSGFILKRSERSQALLQDKNNYFFSEMSNYFFHWTFLSKKEVNTYWHQLDFTHLPTDLLLNALLSLRQCRHRCHVGPAERSHHRLQDYISKQLLHVCEEHVKDSVPNLNMR